MKLTITKTIGKNKYPFTFEGEDLFECVLQSENLSFYDVYKCGNCESDNLRLHAYEAGEKGFKYVTIVCNECRSTATFGKQTKNPNIFYLRKENGKIIWKKFEGKTDDKSDDELPF